MPVSKYKLEDFQVWIENQSKERRHTLVRMLWDMEDSEIGVKDHRFFGRLDSNLKVHCDACIKEYEASYSDGPYFSAPPSDNCLETECLKIKKVWQKGCQNRNFGRMLSESWDVNKLGETANDVILKWMNEVDQKKNHQILESGGSFTQNQLVLAPKK